MKLERKAVPRTTTKDNINKNSRKSDVLRRRPLPKQQRPGLSSMHWSNDPSPAGDHTMLSVGSILTHIVLLFYFPIPQAVVTTILMC